MNNTFTIRMKGSCGKLPSETNSSPYNQIFQRRAKEKAKTIVLKKSSLMTRKNSFYCRSPEKSINDLPKLPKRNRISESNISAYGDPSELEKLLVTELDKFKSGESKFISELEIAESIFRNLLHMLKPFTKILTQLQETFKLSYYNQAKEVFKSKLEKLDREKNGLVQKISRLSDINSALVEEKNQLEERTAEFDRMFKENPKILINYQNIVSQMLGQCEKIENQDKELKRMKKVEDSYKKLLCTVAAASFLDGIVPESEYQFVN